MPRNYLEKKAYSLDWFCEGGEGLCAWCLRAFCFLLCWLPLHIVWDISMGLIYGCLTLPFAILGLLIPMILTSLLCYLEDTLVLPYVLGVSKWFGGEVKILIILLQPIFSVFRLAVELIFCVHAPKSFSALEV